jgi:glycine cleavage system H protein
MVAVLFALTITMCLLVDWTVQLGQARQAKRRALTSDKPARATISTSPLQPPFNVYFHHSHVWAQILRDGHVRIGLDGLVGFLLGDVDSVELPTPGQELWEGETFAILRQGDRELRLRAPMESTVARVNGELAPDGHFMITDPYGAGWICEVEPKALSKDLGRLMVGDEMQEWHKQESDRIIDFLSGAGNESEIPSLPGLARSASNRRWSDFQSEFLS